MALSRRGIVKAFTALPLASALFEASACAEPIPDQSAVPAAIKLPDRSNFSFEGIDLNAAYAHVMSKRTGAAEQEFIRQRMTDPGVNWPAPNGNARDRAASLYAKLINANPIDIAVVQSTLEGENLIAAALDLGPDRGVVTDQFHYDASLAMYGERAKRGMPLAILKPREWKIDYAELDRSITSRTKLVAVSLVSSPTGYKHDLKRVCEIAHAKGAFVYADVIQAAGCGATIWVRKPVNQDKNP